MATAFDAGRALTPEAVTAWRDAATPFLDGDGGQVMDLGAGTGRFSALLAEWSDSPVVAVEPALAMARQAKNKELADVDVVNGRAESIPLRDGSVRAAWLSNVVHHVDDLGAAVSELGRVLRPHGRVLIRGAFGREGESDDGRANFRIHHYFPDARRFADAFPSRQQIVDAFDREGFAEEVTTSVAQVTASSLREFARRIRTRADSTLAPLDEDAFAAGLAALERDAVLEISPQPVVDDLDLVVLRTPG